MRIALIGLGICSLFILNSLVRAAGPTEAAPAVGVSAKPDQPLILLAVRDAGLPLGGELIVLPNDDALPEPPGPSVAAYNERYYSAARRVPPGLGTKLDGLRGQQWSLYDDKGVRCSAKIAEISIVRFGQAWGDSLKALRDAAQLASLSEKLWSTPGGPGGRDGLQHWKTVAAVKLTGDTAACAGAMVAVPSSRKLLLGSLRSAKSLEASAFQDLDSSDFGESISAKVQLERLPAGLSRLSARMVVRTAEAPLLLLYVSVFGARSLAFYTLTEPESLSGSKLLGIAAAPAPSRALGADFDGDGKTDVVVVHASGVIFARHSGPSWSFNTAESASPLKKLDG